MTNQSAAQQASYPLLEAGLANSDPSYPPLWQQSHQTGYYPPQTNQQICQPPIYQPNTGQYLANQPVYPPPPHTGGQYHTDQFQQIAPYSSSGLLQANQPMNMATKTAVVAYTHGPPGSDQHTIKMQKQQNEWVALDSVCPTCRTDLKVSYSVLGICCAVFFFPMGLICCLMMSKQRCPSCGAIYK